MIVLEGAVEQLPEALTAQLKESGRIACIFMEGTLGVVRIGYKIDGQINWAFFVQRQCAGSSRFRSGLRNLPFRYRTLKRSRP